MKKDFVEFSGRYPGTMSWLTYNSLIQAIPARQKSILDRNTRKDESYEYCYENLKARPKLVTKTVYFELTSNALMPANPYNRWCKVFTKHIGLEEFALCFKNLYKITNNTKLCDFQFRLLHKRVPTNKDLYTWKI